MGRGAWRHAPKIAIGQWREIKPLGVSGCISRKIMGHWSHPKQESYECHRRVLANEEDLDFGCPIGYQKEVTMLLSLPYLVINNK